MRLGYEHSERVRSVRGWLFAIAFSLCAATLAEQPEQPKRLAASLPPNTVPVGTLNSIFFAPSPLPPKDALYLRLFAATDAGVYRQYQDRWSYHEMQIPYAATEWNHEHLTIGTLDFFGRAPYEGDVRHDFAQQVLRVRLDAALRELTKDTEGAKTMARAQKAVDSVKNMPIKVGGGSHPGEFHIGYDVLSDASKFEYVKGPWLAGVYHPHLISALTGQRAGQNDLSLRVTASLANPLPSASIGYQPGNTVMELSLSRALSRSVNTRILSSTPTVSNGTICQYRAEVSYSF